MEVFVFSYNRGCYLRNCLHSLDRHTPGLPVTVIDDASSDPEVDRVLSNVAGHMRVWKREKTGSGHHLGGLYPNMNLAIEAAESDIALFIQDDMQLVRDLTRADRAHIERFFEHYPGAIELHNAFFKRTQGSVTRSDIDLDEEVPVYFRKPDGRGSVYFSAVGIFRVDRLRALDFEFSNFESGNDARLAELVDRMGISPYPSMMWLPFAETAKFRCKGLLQRYAEWKTGAGFYPYRAMREDEVGRLLHRDVRELPLAEDWLDPQGMPPRQVWNFADAAKFVPMTKKILKLRKRLRRKLSRER